MNLVDYFYKANCDFEIDYVDAVHCCPSCHCHGAQHVETDCGGLFSCQICHYCGPDMGAPSGPTPTPPPPPIPTRPKRKFVEEAKAHFDSEMFERQMALHAYLVSKYQKEYGFQFPACCLCGGPAVYRNPCEGCVQKWRNMADNFNNAQ